MNKERFNELKMKFTDGNGNYIFKVPIMQMNITDLREYIDYIAEKLNKASYYANSGSFKAISYQAKCQEEYIDILNSVRVNRPDFKLSDREIEISKFKGAVQIG